MKPQFLLVSSLVVPSVAGGLALAFLAPACSSSTTGSPVMDGSAEAQTQPETSTSQEASSSTGDASDSDAGATNGCDAGIGAACPLTYYDPAWCAAPWDEDAAVADGGDTWDTYMHGFFENYCVECHHPGGQGNPSSTALDFRTQPDPVKNASTIRCGIIPLDAGQDPSWNCGSFPPPAQFPIYDAKKCNQKPSDTARWRVVTWIEAGSP
jgi:hypothetical protein